MNSEALEDCLELAVYAGDQEKSLNLQELSDKWAQFCN